VKIQIPIYRAKYAHEQEYSIGYYFKYDDALGIRHMMISKESGIEEEIDHSTLAINFPNWIDVNKNKVWDSLEQNNNNLVIVNSPFMIADSSGVECSVFFNGIEFEVRALNSRGLKKNYFFLSNLVGENGSTFGSLKVTGVQE